MESIIQNLNGEVVKMISLKRKVFIFTFLVFRIFTVCCNANDGLIAYWPIDEGNGNIVNDKSGHGNTGHIYGKVKWINGQNGKKALLFDGISTYINCGNSAIFKNISDEITIEAWIKLNSKQGGGIVNKYFPSSGYYLTAAWRDDQLPYFFARNATNATFLRGSMLGIGKWHHLLVTAKLNDKIQLYINGDLFQEKVLDNTFENNTCDLLIGKYQQDYFSGAISDVKIYNKVIDKCNNPVIKRKSKQNQNRLISIENDFSHLKEKFFHLTAKANPEAVTFRDNLKNRINLLENQIKRLKSTFSNLTKFEFVDELRRLSLYLKQLDKVLDALEKQELPTKDFLITIVKPITNIPILPQDIFIPGKISNEISLKSCPGEYEPSSFVISAFSEISCLSLEITDLKSSKDFIPAKNVNIKAVKCWYQARTAWTGVEQNKTKRILVPDLLINDDNLLQVDMSQQENYLKVITSDGGKYIWISNPDEKCKFGHPSNEELPVKDSAILLPLTIRKGYNKQFWLTIKIPDAVYPGHYKGLIRLKTPKSVLDEIEINLDVLPFKLDTTYYTSSIYYSGKLDKTGKGTISSELKNDYQLKKDFENMAAHGITNPVCYQEYDEKKLKKYLDIKKNNGLDLSPFYYLEMGIYRYIKNFNLENASLLSERVKKIIEFSKGYGIDEFYFYAIDEAKAERLTAQRRAWKTIHNAGGKIFVAGEKGANFKLMGDLQDLNISHGALSKEEAQLWHSAKHQVWSYANPQSGVKNPEIYRKNYGILLWQYNYDGACTFAYQRSMGNIWNDFDHKQYRDHNFTYPTVNGVIDTIAWEGYREGIKDVKYLTTLLNKIKVAKNARGAKNNIIINEAEAFLAELKKSDINKLDMDNIRNKMTQYILRFLGN